MVSGSRGIKYNVVCLCHYLTITILREANDCLFQQCASDVNELAYITGSITQDDSIHESKMHVVWYNYTIINCFTNNLCAPSLCTTNILHTCNKDGRNIRFVFEILNIRMFSSYLIKNSQLCKRTSLEYFPSVLCCKMGPGRSFTSSLNYEKDYNHQTTPHKSDMYTYTHITC